MTISTQALNAIRDLHQEGYIVKVWSPINIQLELRQRLSEEEYAALTPEAEDDIVLYAQASDSWSNLTERTEAERELVAQALTEGIESYKALN